VFSPQVILRAAYSKACCISKLLRPSVFVTSFACMMFLKADILKRKKKVFCFQTEINPNFDKHASWSLLYV